MLILYAVNIAKYQVMNLNACKVEYWTNMAKPARMQKNQEPDRPHVLGTRAARLASLCYDQAPHGIPVPCSVEKEGSGEAAKDRKEGYSMNIP